MAISKVTTASITTDAVGSTQIGTDAVGPTQLNEAANYDFTGTVTGAGGVNTPAFEAYLSSVQVIPNVTVTKINMDTERFDTANDYDNSTNYRFTPQTAGKYFVYAHFNLQTNGKKIANAIPSIHKNGSNYTQSASNFSNDTTSTIAIGITNVITMNGSSDYLEVFAYMEAYDSAEARIQPELAGSYFGAYKIIE